MRLSQRDWSHCLALGLAMVLYCTVLYCTNLYQTKKENRALHFVAMFPSCHEILYPVVQRCYKLKLEMIIFINHGSVQFMDFRLIILSAQEINFSLDILINLDRIISNVQGNQT